VLAPSFLQQYAMQIKGAAAFLAARINEAGQLKTNAAAGPWPMDRAHPSRGVSTPSRYTLVVELEKPDTTSLAGWRIAFGMAVARETLPDPLKDLGAHPVGTGRMSSRNGCAARDCGTNAIPITSGPGTSISMRLKS